jgi:hypothetical protein
LSYHRAYIKDIMYAQRECPTEAPNGNVTWPRSALSF